MAYGALCTSFAATGLLVGTLAASQSTRSLALLCGAAFVYVALFVWQPAVALLTYIALRPLVDAFVYQELRGFTLGEIWGFGMVVSACLFLLLESRDRVQRLALAAVPVAFLFALAMLTVTRPELTAAVADWTKVASWILVMLVCERISRDPRGQWMCWWAGTVMGATLVVSVGIMILQGRYGSVFYRYLGVSGQLPHVLSTGAVLLLPIALAGALLVGRRGLSLAVTVGLLAAIVLSYVRTALLGAVVVLVALLAVSAKSGGKVRVAGLALAVVAVLTAFVQRDQIAQRFTDLTLLSASGTAQGAAGSGRLAIWRTDINAAFDGVQHTIIGRGAQAAERIGQQALGFHVGAQNDFLEFLLAGGLLLGICFLVLLAWMVLGPVRILTDEKQSSPAKSFATLGLGAVAAFILMSMLNGIAFYQPSVAVGLVVGLCRGMSATPGGTFLDASAHHE